MSSIGQKIWGPERAVPHVNNDNVSGEGIKSAIRTGPLGAWEWKTNGSIVEWSNQTSLLEKLSFLLERAIKWWKGDWEVDALAMDVIVQIENERAWSSLNYSQMAFVMIDPQVGFVDGSFNVPANPEVVKKKELALKVAARVCQYLKSKGALIVATKDHHPDNSKTFHTEHDVSPYTVVTMPKSAENNFSENDKQMVWPKHCVYTGDKQALFVDEGETEDAKFHSSFDSSSVDVVCTKGLKENEESYSAVYTVYGKIASPLLKILQDNNISRVFMGGLCTDYCVGHSAGHLAISNIHTTVVAAAAAGINDKALTNLEETSKLLVNGQWRRDINDPKTAYELNTPNEAYQPCDTLLENVANFKEGRIKNNPLLNILPVNEDKVALYKGEVSRLWRRTFSATPAA